MSHSPHHTCLKKANPQTISRTCKTRLISQSTDASHGRTLRPSNHKHRFASTEPTIWRGTHKTLRHWGSTRALSTRSCHHWVKGGTQITVGNKDKSRRTTCPVLCREHKKRSSTTSHNISIRNIRNKKISSKRSHLKFKSKTKVVSC